MSKNALLTIALAVGVFGAVPALYFQKQGLVGIICGTIISILVWKAQNLSGEG